MYFIQMGGQRGGIVVPFSTRQYNNNFVVPSSSHVAFVVSVHQ